MANTTVYIEVLDMMLNAWIEKVTIYVLKRLLPPIDQEFSQLCHLIPNILPLNLNFLDFEIWGIVQKKTN